MDDLLQLPDWEALVAATNWDDNPLRLPPPKAPAAVREPLPLPARQPPTAAIAVNGFLVQPNAQTDFIPQDEQYLLVVLGKATYALALASLVEISRVDIVTPIPNLPAWLSGVINLRGDIFSVIDLRSFLDDTPSVNSRRARLVLVRTPDQSLSATLLVDQIREMCRLTTAQIHPEVAAAPYIKGRAEYKGHPITVLDITQLLLVSRERLHAPHPTI